MYLKDGKLYSSKTKKEVIIYDVDIDRCEHGSKKRGFKNIIWLTWNSNIGFGEITIIEKSDGTYDCETETMCSNEDKLFVQMVFNKLIEKLNIIE